MVKMKEIKLKFLMLLELFFNVTYRKCGVQSPVLSNGVYFPRIPVGFTRSRSTKST